MLQMLLLLDRNKHVIFPHQFVHMRLDELEIRVDGLFQLWGWNRRIRDGRGSGSRRLLGVLGNVDPIRQSQFWVEEDKGTHKSRVPSPTLPQGGFGRFPFLPHDCVRQDFL